MKGKDATPLIIIFYLEKVTILSIFRLSLFCLTLLKTEDARALLGNLSFMIQNLNLAPAYNQVFLD